MGVPPARWMVYFVENPNLNWMMTGGTPILGHLHMFCGGTISLGLVVWMIWDDSSGNAKLMKHFEAVEFLN